MLLGSIPDTYQDTACLSEINTYESPDTCESGLHNKYSNDH